MSGCIDKRYEDMLHAFEMGMLNDDDYREFQLHLLDCRHCFERAQKFEAAIELMRTDTDILGVPRRIVGEQTKPKAEVSEQKISRSRKRFWPALVPTTLIAAIVVIFLVLKPWQFEIRSDQEAVAEENRLAIMFFDNLAAPEDTQRLGEIITSLLIADLSESRYLQVVSSLRLYDILRLLGKDKSKITNREIAAQVAGKAGAKWMLTGSVLQVKPQLVFTSQLVEVSSGIVIASQQATGREGDDVFSLVDRLTVQVKNELPLPSEARQEPDRPVADVTTHSPLAYRYYLEGVVYQYRYYNAEAVESFKKALEIDSTFAMVYYYLSLIDDADMITKAVEYSDKVSRKEGHFIRSREAFLSGDIDRAIRELQESLVYHPDDKEIYYRIGICYVMQLEFEKAIRSYKKAIEIDPLYKAVYNQMAYTYDWMGEFEKSVQAIDMYISLAPQEANPYDSRGDIYTRNGRLRLAIDSYAGALEIKPDFWISLYKLGRNYLFIGKFAIADSCFRELAACDNPLWRSNGMVALAYIPLYQGRFNEAIRILDEGIELIGKDPDGIKNPLFSTLKAIAYEEKDNLNLALKECEESINVNHLQSPDDKKYNQHLLAQYLAQTGDTERAEKVTENLRKNIVLTRDTLRYRYAAASVELAKGNLEQATAAFEKAAEDTVIPYTPAYCELANTYLEAGRWSDAKDVMERFLQIDFTETRLHYGSWIVKAHYFIGLAHEELGHTDLAIEQYQIFLNLWKHADPGIVEIDDVRERLARLKSKS